MMAPMLFVKTLALHARLKFPRNIVTTSKTLATATAFSKHPSRISRSLVFYSTQRKMGKSDEEVVSVGCGGQDVPTRKRNR